MMVERHYDDEALLTLMEGDRFRSDAHLAACTPCGDKLHTFRTITEVLHEHDVWDSAEIRRDPVPATIASLRAFADRMSFEDAAAEAILPELLAGAREQWMPRLMAHPEWRTAGVVRRLVGETTRVVMTMPPDALEMTALSTEIADHLTSRFLQPQAVAQLRGAAWRDRAYALFYVGRFAEALQATDRADTCFRQCVVDEYDRARVTVIRALALRAREEVADAMSAIRFSVETFAQFEDATRLASARMAETHLLFTKGQFAEALEILVVLERQLRRTQEGNIHARVLGNMGYCLWKLGRIDEALRHHDASAALLADLGVHTEAVRVRWNVASIVAAAGRVDEALARLSVLQKEFDNLGMTSESALASLDVAELLISLSDFTAIEAICRSAMSSFEKAGISYTARALTALAYIREAAQHRAVTPRQVQHVRNYLRRLPQDGELLFAPLPPFEMHAPTPG